MRAGRGWLLAAGACLLGFVGLALRVTGSSALTTMDSALHQAAVAHRSPGWTTAFQAWTTLGALPVVVGVTLAGVLVLVRRTRSWVLPTVLTVAVALSSLTVALVKVGVGRPRPGAGDRIGPPARDFAFPSGHTGDGTAALLLVTALVCLTLPRSVARSAAIVAAVLLAAGIGVSRVYLGYHWPTDVVGGWLLATTFTCVAVSLVLALDVARPHRPGRSVKSS